MGLRKHSYVLFTAISVFLSDTQAIRDQDDNVCTDPDSCSEECVDKDPRCLKWAENGECSKNPKYMLQNCIQSCETCSNPIITISETDEECQDHHPSCQEWASVGECIANAGYMLEGCKKACSVCIDVSQARDEGMAEDEILRRYRFVNGNWGAPQPYQGNETEKGLLKKVLISSRDYALFNVTLLPLEERLLCQNQQQLCSFWASLGQCEENLAFMMKDCPLACNFCHTKVLYDKCHAVPKSHSWMDNSDEEDFAFMWMDKTYNSIKKLAKNSELISSDKKKDIVDPSDPWVLKVEDFITSSDSDELVRLAKTLEWIPSSTLWQKNEAGGDNTLVRRESSSAFCNVDKCKDHDVYQKIRKLILGLMQDVENHHLEEPMEFVHYKAMQSFGVHHDFNIHDNWKPAGARVLSFFLCLSDVEQGGAIGFPDLDWLIVPPQKGQLLVWPNVILEKNLNTRRHPDMSSEGLPVTSGEKYGIHIWVRLKDYESAKNQGCL